MSKIDRTDPIPPFESDEAAEAFVANADLSRYDLSDMKRTSLEAMIKEIQLNVRLPKPLYQAVKAAAARQGIPYSRFVRRALEAAVASR